MIGSIGAGGAANQLLSNLLSRLSSKTANNTSTSTDSSISSSSASTTTSTSAASGSSAMPTLSGNVLAVLMFSQQQSQDAGAPTTTGSSDGSSGISASQDPMQQLFAAMDSDGDGEVSQGEMESYIENKGGTQQQADALFTSLDQNGASGIGEDQMQTAVTQAKQSDAAHMHHHRHHGMGGSGSAESLASTFMQALDANGDGSVSEDEFSDYLTQNGGATAAYAQTEFGELDSDSSGTLTSADFTKALQSYQASNQSARIVSMLDKLAQSTGGATAATTA